MQARALPLCGCRTSRLWVVGATSLSHARLSENKRKRLTIARRHWHRKRVCLGFGLSILSLSLRSKPANWAMSLLSTPLACPIDVWILLFLECNMADEYQSIS